MARRRAENRTGRDGHAWWWLALPALGVAAYAAFDATLGLMGDERAREAPPATREVVGSGAVASTVAPQPPREADAPVAAAAPVDLPPADEPAPTPTASDARVAADAATKAKPKPKAAKPKESLTDQDRRALDRVIERATEPGTR